MASSPGAPQFEPPSTVERLFLTLVESTGACDAARLEALCAERPELDDTKVEQFLILQPTRTDPALFEAVLPGAYELSFATWRKGGTSTVFVPLGTPVQFKVEPGETQRVNL